VAVTIRTVLIESKVMLDQGMGHSEPQNRSTGTAGEKVTLTFCEKPQNIPAPVKGKATGSGNSLQEQIRQIAPKLRCADNGIAENSIILRGLKDKRQVQQIHACIGNIKRSQNLWLHARTKKTDAGLIDMMVFRVRAPRGSANGNGKSNETWGGALSS
jgi:hypothetical protein